MNAWPVVIRYQYLATGSTNKNHVEYEDLVWL